VQKWGASRIEAVMLSLAWYRDHSAPFKAALEDGTLELVRDADHLDDLRAFQVVKGIPLLPDTRSKGQDGSQRHGDAGVAYLLAYAASRSESLGATRGFESVPRRGGEEEAAPYPSQENVLMPKLVDQYGRPIDQGALREPQTRPHHPPAE
jgi:phage FluMu gp28-like protein